LLVVGLPGGNYRIKGRFLFKLSQIYPKMNNLLKVSAAALFLAVGLTSCESKTAESTTETTTTPATESTTTTAATDSASTTTAPAEAGTGTGAPATAGDTTQKM
jgi:hypothetical protein